MLNRRTLRIKIMQSLFAFDQCKEANYELALAEVEDHFVPDLNSMEVQDKALLKSQQKDARRLIEKKFENPDTPESEDKAVNAAVKAAMLHNGKQVKKDFTFLGKNMVLEVEKINDHYLSVLGLLIAFAEQAGTEKKGEYTNFRDNPLVATMSANVTLKGALVKTNAGWNNRQDKVRSWFRDIIRADAEFKKYSALTKPLAEDHKSILRHLIRKVILGKSIIQDYYEEEDIHWAEDKDIVKSLVDKTVKSMEESSGTIELQKLSLDWEDDRRFMDKLFADSTSLEAGHKELIAQNTKNWEVDRLPLTDRIILEMAIAELIGFPGIPVKVTINEYIELAKLYSTPKSRQFINGILDVIAKELQQRGAIRKSGRGLIDNK